jgi:hypothetical protein
MSLFTTRSTLMHAVLVHLSPELNTFDAIIHHATTPLPTEILLHIRLHLLAALITHLRSRSSSALLQYELSLRSVLCPECIAYNEDIFGLDVWQWTHFSGPCGCLSRVQNHHTPPSEPTLPWTNRITDSHQWLESYLSCEAIKLAGSSSLGSPATIPPIWNLVHLVLGEYGCEALRGAPCSNTNTNTHRPPSSPIRATHQPNTKSVLARWDQKSQNVLIVPLASALRLAEEAADKEDRSAHHAIWRRNTILKRVERELGLFEYPEDSAPHAPKVTLSLPSTPPLRPAVPSTKPPELSRPSLLKQSFAVISACASFPHTFVTGIVIIFCYYHRLGIARNF